MTSRDDDVPAPLGSIATLLVLAGVAGATAYVTWMDGSAICATFAAVGLSLAALAVWMAHRRAVREARYGEHLQQAVREDELLLHSLSVAIPAHAASELPSEVDAALAHRLFDAFHTHLRPGALFAYTVERLGETMDAAGAIEGAARSLEERASFERSATYRGAARASGATAEQDGLVVATLLLVAHPTALGEPEVRTVGDALALRDAILPIAPEHTRAARVVITPGDGSRSFGPSALAAAFPELEALPAGPRTAGGQASPADPVELVAAMKQRAMRFELASQTLAASIDAIITRIARDEDVELTRPSDLDALIEAHRTSIAERDTTGRMARREVLARVELAVNEQLSMARHARRLARVVALDGVALDDAFLVLVTPSERARLRATGRVIFTPWVRDTAPAVVVLVAAGPLGFASWQAVADLDASRIALVVVAWAAWAAARVWLRRRMVGLAFGRNAPG